MSPPRISFQSMLIIFPRTRHLITIPTLFRSQRRTRLGDDGIAHIVKRSAAKASLKRRVHPHNLRHSDITALAERNVNPWALQQFAGHSDISTTMRYLHICDTAVGNEIRSAPMLFVEDLPPRQEVGDLKVQLSMRLAFGEIDATTYNRAMASLESSTSSDAVITSRIKSGTKNTGRTR